MEQDCVNAGTIAKLCNKIQKLESERDAEVARKAILAAAEDYQKEYMGQGVERFLTEFADVYVKRIKDGG